MSKAERQGYTSWDNAKEAGVVGEDILWHDDEIYRDCTLGEIKHTIGMAYPIDLAVAFTLGAVGRDRGLTVKEMVNDHTRRATLLMTGKIGWGELPVPESEDCGHDMISATLFEFPKIDSIGSDETFNFLNTTNYTLASQMRGTQWVNRFGEPPEEVLALTSFRTNDAVGTLTSDAMRMLHMDVFAPLREYLLECFPKTFVTESTVQSPIPLIHDKTLGKCAFTSADVDENGKRKRCAHHKPTFERGWWMLKDSTNSLMQIWFTGKDCMTTSGWNNRQFRNSTNSRIKQHYHGNSWNLECSVPKGDVLRFSTHARNMVNALDDKDVIKQIRKSLNRMKNWAGRDLLDYDLNGRDKRGNYTLYSWSNWAWLENIHTLAKYTNSKNRKIGDRVCTKCYAAGHCDEEGNGLCLETCNEGWTYDKFGKHYMHGHEIAKFRWIPIMGNATYKTDDVGVMGSSIKPPHVFAFDSWPELDVMFATEQEIKLSRKLMTGSITRMNGLKLNADWDEATDTRQSVTEEDMKDGGLGFTTVQPRENIWVQLPAEIQPEEFSTAYDLYMGALCGTPDFFDEFEEYFTENKNIRVYSTTRGRYESMLVKKPTIIPAVEEIEEVVVDAE